jgi:starch phosphorylase
MDYQGKDQQNCAIYTSNISYSSSGLQGLSLRLIPRHDYLSNPLEMGLVLWAQG